MSTQQHQYRQNGQIAISSLRARAADFFKMDVPQATRKAPAHDRNPLRRSLNCQQDINTWVSNEVMCTALWELMARG